MISSGCFLVPIGSKQSRHNNDPNLEMEWRLSFVLAEQILVRAMNHCQFMCYALLKVFLQEVLNKDAIKEDQKISSYFLKTAMFWCIQSDAKYNWSRENFFECFWKYAIKSYCSGFTQVIVQTFLSYRTTCLSVRLQELIKRDCLLKCTISIVIEMDA